MNLLSNKTGVSLLFILFCLQGIKAVDYDVISPNSNFTMTLHINNGTQYEINYGQTQLISPSTIGMNLQDGTVVGKGTIKSVERNVVDNVLSVLIGKNKTLQETYNELIVHFNENYDLVVRAYNEGIAYRFVTAFPNNIIVNSEDAIFNFAGNPKVYFPEVTTFDSWERIYNIYSSVNNLTSGQFAVTPTLFSYPNTSYKIAICEANLFDYPGLYIQSNGVNSMKGMWANYPDSVSDPTNVYSNHAPVTRFNYIANTTGTRAFPWRVIIVSNDDKSLLNNELVYMLAEPQKLTDVSWVVPGKSSWEWWHKAMLTADGSANPTLGIPANGNSNLGLTLYEYYIDFAAKNHFEYMTLDAGWSESYIAAVCAYAKTKNVKIIVWTWASDALETPNWIAKMKRYGVSGVKIDFFQRNDQLATRWGPILAQQLADQKMVGIFHGCPVPTGLNRTYPNLLNFEAIVGEEEDFWRRDSDPNYHVQFPFMRSLAGPEDYTPGSMRNTSQRQFVPVDQLNTVPSSQGTRTHELSMYIVNDQWLGYMSDAPTEYMKFPDILDFLSNVPTVWDKTVPLDASLGEYILVAKQKGTDWYVGGMTSWTGRDINVDFSFLKPNVTYQATVLRDDPSSSSYPTRYVSEKVTVTSDTKLTYTMAMGGGFVIRLTEVVSDGLSAIKSNSSISICVDNSRKAINVYSTETIQSVDIYNVSGQLVLSEKSITNNSYMKQIDISKLTRGTFIVKVQSKNNISSSKFIN